MSSSKHTAAIAIGVGEARPLPFLSGAVNGAKSFHQWAQALRYNTILVTDEQEPVTAARLRAELEGVLAAGRSGIYRLLIYFAGHGLIREVEEGLWLLSDWYGEQRAVAVEPLRRRLSFYPVEQVAIFADACRSLPPDFDTADLTPDAILGRGPGPRSPRVAIDKFVATQEGTRTFMIPGANPGDDRCLFSGVLLEGLWGTKETALSKVVSGRVTSRSLGAFLETEVPKIAKQYGCMVEPQASPTFPEGDDVYFGDPPRVAAPQLPDWPPTDALIVLGPDEEPKWLDKIPTPGRATPSVTGLQDQLRKQERPAAFETGAGFAVDGDAVTAIWTPRNVAAEMHVRPDWWRLRTANRPRLDMPAAVLIELAGGTFAAPVALPKFIASLVVRGGGVAGLVYREVHSPPQVAKATEAALGQLEAGSLRADAVADLAIELRHGKHADPVRGVISAYLYDSIGDMDSIRRMATFYVQHGQAIPYDIALLAQLEGEMRADGLLSVVVPAVRPRKPRTRRESRVKWSHSATPRTTGIVGGLWPWLRQGWAFLDDPAPDGSTLVLPGLVEVASELTSARFTTLRPGGARRLAEVFALRPGLFGP
jgi:hypothetical protein